MSRFEAVLFDLDGTLCRRTQDTASIYAEAFEQVGTEPFGEPADLWAALDGPPDHDDWVGYIAAGFARVAAQHGRRDGDPVALAEALAALSDDTKVELLDGADEALRAAAACGPVGLVTNGPERNQRPKLDALDLTDRLDGVVYAADLDRQKPLAHPFERALAAIDRPADRTLYVGNSLGYDVAGAHNAGLAAAWLRDGDDEPAPYDPEYVVESLTELPAILEGER